MRQLLAITRKELENYFGSPLALIFLGSFIGAVLFIFFSVETFFARNVAEIRPLFRWMPLLLVFLLAALTMRQWSEEQRAGTLEILLTLPVRPLYLVLGKFLAVMTLIGVALALTLPLPLTAALLGNLDWGPVFGGYLAALLLAAAYAALGLFISSRTDNQIVALILSVLVGGVLYLLGTPAVTDLFSGSASRFLWSLGTSSRFESIERGVIDLRDLVYYLSLTVFFLLLNLLSIDSKRWSRRQRAYRRRLLATAVLLTANLLLLNIWLTPLQGLRADLTATQEYSLSQTTYDLVGNLQEPLLIRGYISERTHPLLAPLTPRIADLLREYEIAGRGMITAEVIDPITNPELENEANQLYGIQPRPYQIADRYESTVINSYFNILLQYGDQTVVLGFDDLVQTTTAPDGSVDVQLSNLEYDLTRGIKRVLYGFQSIDAVLAALDDPVELTLFITPESLPAWMIDAQETITAVAQEIEADAGGKFQFTVVNPDDPNSAINRTFLLETYGLPGIPVDAFSSETYYAHMLLANGDNGQIIYPSGEINESGVRTAIESALKRSTTGFLKVVGLWTPPNAPLNDPVLGDVLQPMVSYQALQQQLGQEYTLQTVDLSQGLVPLEIDVLVLLAPQEFTEAELFAVDQYLMRGGSVVVAASNYGLAFDNFTQGFALYPVNNGIAPLLAHYGVNLADGVVMDAQNSPFPVVTVRSVQGTAVQEVQAADYPFFVDVRPNGMSEESVITGNIPAVTLSYASPVELDPNLNAGRETEVLLSSSSNAWLRLNGDITPDFALYPETGFAVGNSLTQYPLAVSVQGQFESYFKDRELPGQTDAEPATVDELLENSSNPRLTTIPQSPEAARLVVIGSSSFMEDLVMDLTSVFQGEAALSNLQLLQNGVDWAVEDLDLLAIRARGGAVRVLNPLTEDEQRIYEVANYIFALLALVGIFIVWRLRRQTAPLLLDAGVAPAAEGEEALATETEAEMNRIQQILLGFLVVQAIIAAIVFWPEPATAVSTAPLLGEWEPAAVTAFSIEDDLGNLLELEKRSDGWVVANAGDFPVNDGAPEDLLAKLTAITGDRLVAQTSSSHGRLGVAPQEFQRRITLRLADGSGQTFYLGSAQSARAVHVRLENQDPVYLTSAVNVFEAAATIGSWVDTQYVQLEQGSLQRVTLQNGSGEYSFQPGPTGAWALTDLAADEVSNGANVTNLVARLPGLRFVRPLGTAVDPAYGLDAPTAVVTMTTPNGEYTLRIGAQDENGDYYAAYSDSPYVVLLANSNAVNLVNWTRAEFLESGDGE